MDIFRQDAYGSSDSPDVGLGSESDSSNICRLYYSAPRSEMANLIDILSISRDQAVAWAAGRQPSVCSTVKEKEFARVQRVPGVQDTNNQHIHKSFAIPVQNCVHSRKYQMVNALDSHIEPAKHSSSQKGL